MPANQKFAAVLVVLAAAFGAKSAAAAGCSYYDCTSETLIYPQPAPYARYHYVGHAPDHNYAPMAFSDGQGGHVYGQWYWGGMAWAHVPSQYYDLYRGGRW